jgi:hypothetical protein
MASELLCPIGTDKPSGFCLLPDNVFAAFAEFVNMSDKKNLVIVSERIEGLRKAIAADAQETSRAIESILSSGISCTGDVREMRDATDYSSKTLEQKCLQDLLVFAGCLRHIPRASGAIGQLSKVQESMRDALDILVSVKVGAERLTRGARDNEAREELLFNIDSVSAMLQSMLVVGGTVGSAKDQLISGRLEGNRSQRSAGYRKLLDYAAASMTAPATVARAKMEPVASSQQDNDWAEPDAPGRSASAPYVAPYIPALAASANEAGPSIYGTGYDSPAPAQRPQASAMPMLARFRNAPAAASSLPGNVQGYDNASVVSSQSQYSGLTGLTTHDVAQQPVYEHGFTDLKSIEAFLNRSRRGRR